MKNILLPDLRVLLALLLWTVVARAQNPRLDPAFQPTEMYRPGGGQKMIAQPDGKTLLLGNFTRLGGLNVAGLARLLPNGQPDLAFQANVAGLVGGVGNLALLPSGKILLYGFTTLQLGPVSRRNLLLLRSDGTPDASFNAGPGATNAASFGLVMVGQPDGKILLAGYLPQVGGQATGNIARLNANGTLDAGFRAAGPGLDDAAEALMLQPDGKIVVAGRFTTVQGVNRPVLARLLPSGALDVSFVAPNNIRQVYELGLLPNGNLMVLGRGFPPSLPLVRLLPNGRIDPTFQAGSNLVVPGFTAPKLLVLSSGNVLISSGFTQYNGAAVGPVFQVLPSGSRDPGFVPALTPTNAYYEAPLMAELPNGQVLLTGADFVPTGRRTALGLVRLDANGSFDASFTPALFQPGSLSDVARQANGQLVVGGDFTEINGTPAGNLARLNPDGTVEAAFTAAAAADGPVKSVLVQPDGRVLALGRFEQVGGSPQRCLARLQASGARDASFAPALGRDSYVNVMALQPNGQVLLAGQFQLAGSAGWTRAFGRFGGTTGGYDASFQPVDTLVIYDLLVLPTGKIVVAGARPDGTNQVETVWQLLPAGYRDTSFASNLLPQGTNVSSYASALARSASGELYAARLQPSGTSYQADVVRLLPNGSTDPAFRTSLGRGYAALNTLAVQPNGRVLVGGLLSTGLSSTYRGSLRLLSTGATDLAFDPANGPDATVARIVVQPDGALLMAGDFADVAGLPIQGLVRLLDPNVLALRPGAPVASLNAWPVPAHGTLQVAMASLQPVHRLELLDVMGRAVLTQIISGPAATVPLRGVAPGTYLLRVSAPGEASGIRRIVVE